MELKERLVDLRKKKGLSQAELAEAIKVSRQAISRWEVGTAIPSADNLMWLSKFYEVSMDELMGTAIDDKKPKNEEKQVTLKKSEFLKKIVIVILVLACFVASLFAFKRVEQRNLNLEEIPGEVMPATGNDFNLEW